MDKRTRNQVVAESVGEAVIMNNLRHGGMKKIIAMIKRHIGLQFI